MRRIRKDQAVMLVGFTIVAVWLLTGLEVEEPKPKAAEPIPRTEPLMLKTAELPPKPDPEMELDIQIPKPAEITVLPGPVDIPTPPVQPPVRQRFLQQAIIEGPNEGLAGNLVEFNGTNSKGDWFIWICMPPTQGFRPVTLRGGQDCGIIGTKAYFSDLTPGTYQICLVAGAAEGGDVAYHTFVNKKGDSPDPDPDPDPPPPPPPTPTDKLWGVVVEESEKRTAAQNLIIENPEFRAILNGGIRIIDTDNISNPSSKEWIALANALPCLFLAETDGKILWRGPLPATVNDAIALATKYRAFKPVQTLNKQSSNIDTGSWRAAEPVRVYSEPVRVYTLPSVIYSRGVGCPTPECSSSIPGW